MVCIDGFGTRFVVDEAKIRKADRSLMLIKAAVAQPASSGKVPPACAKLRT